ncbi:MAG: hypothetical protein EAZ97_05575 [Bacteroidetes bacterium]|nr:MAG: hypothetical protein EAZ97_05575 [Bacteroidota bacterium]
MCIIALKSPLEMKKIIILIFIFLLPTNANAQEKILNIEDSLLHYPNFFSHTYFFRDSTGHIFEQIKAIDFQKNFQLSSEKISYPTNKKPESLWLKVNIDNQYKHHDYRFFVPKHDSVFVYLLDLQTQKIIFKNISGLLSYEQKEYKEYFWRGCHTVLSLEKGHQYQLFIKVKDSHQNSNLIWIEGNEVWVKAEYENRSIFIEILRIFNGMLLIMFLYNFAVFLISRERIYLYYAFYTFFANLTLLFPYSKHILKDWAIYSTDLFGFSFMLNSIFYLLFSKEFIEVKKYNQRWDRISNYFMILLVPSNLFVLLFFTGNGLAVNLVIMGNIIFNFVFFLSVSSFRNVISKTFFVGNMCLYVCSFFALISSFEFFYQRINIGFAGYYLAQTGIILEILIFSIGLGYRIRLNEQEKRKVQEELNHTLKNQNENLEQNVKEKTKELLKYTEQLQISYEEIQVINEELHQTQEETLAQRDALKTKNSELELQKFKISQSIESAKLIQYAILPTKQKLDSIFTENFVILIPKDTVSGDFYMVNQIDNKKFLIVADCTGHGVSGAFMTMIGNTLIDRIISAGVNSPKDILYKLHFEIQNVLQQKQTNNTDGMDIAIVVLEETDNQVNIVFAAAKRPLYYLSKGEKDVKKIAGSRKMIGGYEMQNKTFENEYLTLPKGSLLYLCTDGYADQNDIERHKFTEKRMLSLISENSNSSLEIQEQILKTQILQHMEGEEQRDDILVLGVKI